MGLFFLLPNPNTPYREGHIGTLMQPGEYRKKLERPILTCTEVQYLSGEKCVQGTPVLLEAEGKQSHLEEQLLRYVEWQQ